MKEITLYKWTNYQAPTKSIQQKRQGFSLSGIMSFDFVGDVEEEQYLLPDEFEIAESNAGTMEIYDKNGRCCDLDISNGQPVIRCGGRSVILGK